MLAITHLPHTENQDFFQDYSEPMQACNRQWKVCLEHPMVILMEEQLFTSMWISPLFFSLFFFLFFFKYFPQFCYRILTLLVIRIKSTFITDKYSMHCKYRMLYENFRHDLSLQHYSSEITMYVFSSKSTAPRLTQGSSKVSETPVNCKHIFTGLICGFEITHIFHFIKILVNC